MITTREIVERLQSCRDEGYTYLVPLSTLHAAAARLDELERENAELRELRRVSFMQMLAVLRQCGDRLEIFNSSFSDIDPLSDTIVQYRRDANDSFVLERRAALAGSGEK